MNYGILNSPTDGNRLYNGISNYKSNCSYQSDLNSNDNLISNNDTFELDSMFNYVNVLKNGTITPEQIGKFHNLGLNFVMKYPEFYKYDEKTQIRIIASIMRNIGVVDYDLPIDEIYELTTEYIKVGNSDSITVLQKMYSDGKIDSQQFRYLNAAKNIFEQNKNNISNVSKPINVSLIASQIDNLISGVKNDKNLSNNQAFSIITSLTVMKYSLKYWNNYIYSNQANISQGGSGNGTNGNNPDFKVKLVVPCCIPGEDIVPCVICDEGDDGGGSGGTSGGGISAACAACINANIYDINLEDALGAGIVLLISTTVVAIIISVATAIAFSARAVYQDCRQQCY